MILAVICLPHADGGSQSIPWGAWDLKISQAPRAIFSLSERLIFLTFLNFCERPLYEEQHVIPLACEVFIWKVYVYFVFCSIIAYQALQKGYVYCVFCNCSIPTNSKSLYLLCFLVTLHGKHEEKHCNYYRFCNPRMRRPQNYGLCNWIYNPPSPMGAPQWS